MNVYFRFIPNNVRVVVFPISVCWIPGIIDTNDGKKESTTPFRGGQRDRNMTAAGDLAFSGYSVHNTQVRVHSNVFILSDHVVVMITRQ